MSRTRIVILQLKEIVYTAIFVGLGILLLVLLFFMFWPDKETSSADTASQPTTASTESSSLYKAGVYNQDLSLGDSQINIQVVLDSNQVKSVELLNMEDSVETMYPLIKPAVKEISDQLVQGVSPEEVVLPDDSPYTSQMVLDSVSDILQEASAQ